MRKIVIIGGTGFIGRHLVMELCRRGGSQITVLRRGHNGAAATTHDIPGVAMRSYDGLTSVEALRSSIEGADTVVNLAGLVSFRQRDRERLRQVNGDGALVVLRACEAAGIPHLLHVSSTAALGFGEATIDEKTSFDWPRYPRCVYSASKALAESALLASPCSVTIAYPSLVLGPGDETNTLPLLRSARRGLMRYPPPGTNSIIDIRDLASGLADLIGQDVPGRKVIVAGEHCSFFEVCRCIAAQLGVAGPRSVLPRLCAGPVAWAALLTETILPRTSLTYETAFLSFQNRRHDTSLMRSLGIRPVHTLKETIRDAVQDFSSRGLL